MLYAFKFSNIIEYIQTHSWTRDNNLYAITTIDLNGHLSHKRAKVSEDCKVKDKVCIITPL
jgi:hypothetical protein